MANNNLFFSELLEDLSSKEFAWWENALRNSLAGTGDPDDFIDEPYLFRLLADNRLELICEDICDFAKFASVLRRFLKACPKRKQIVVNYAMTSSAFRYGEFGGGTLVVTPKAIMCCDGACLIRKLSKKKKKK